MSQEYRFYDVEEFKKLLGDLPITFGEHFISTAEAEDATFEIDDGKEEKCPEDEKTPSLSFASKIFPKSEFEELIAEAKPIASDYFIHGTFEVKEEILFGWPKFAVLRLMDVMIGYYKPNCYPDMFFIGLKLKMIQASSEDPFITEDYIHSQDLKKFQKFKEGKEDPVETIYFRLKFDLKPSVNEIKRVVNELFVINNLFAYNSHKVGGYRPVKYRPNPANFVIKNLSRRA